MIKTIILFSALFQSLFCNPLDEFAKHYQIEDDVLTTHQGIKYPKIPFADELHETLCHKLKDPLRADQIYQAYRTHLFPHLDPALRAPFSTALEKVCYLFGSPTFSPEKPLLEALKEENKDLLTWVDKHPSAFHHFIDAASQSIPVIPRASEIYTIVILTTTAAGGNYSVATAIQSALEGSPIRCILIDSETIAQETDLLQLATGITTYDGFYGKFFQQNNLGLEAIFFCEELYKKFGKYIPSTFGAKLKTTVQELNPDLILSTRNYTLDDIPLCTLGVPFRLIHCDYALSFFLIHLFGKVQPEMIKFWIPSDEAPFFYPLFEKLNRLDLYDESDPYETILKKIALMTDQPLASIQGQFELLGFPVRAAFHRIEEEVELKKLRKKWGVGEDELPILISMGKNGVGILQTLFDECLSFDKPKFPTKYVFVTGTNLALKKDLEEKAAQKKAANCIILGFLSSSEMNEWMNLSTLYVSKPGGAVTSESLETNTYMLITHPHPWEDANGAKIKKEGFAEDYVPDRSLPLQIEEVLEKRAHVNPPVFKPIDWKEQLSQLLKEVLL